MTDKEAAKKAYDSAEEEIKHEQVEKLKLVIKRTLERIKEIDKHIDQLQEEKKILKLDIDDFKEGRLDRIEERQKTDKKAQEVSVIKIEKIHDIFHHYFQPIYEPYKVTWSPQYLPIWSATSEINYSGDDFTLTGTVTRGFTAGTYAVSGNVVHLR
jgi:hypothetical protein